VVDFSLIAGLSGLFCEGESSMSCCDHEMGSFMVKLMNRSVGTKSLLGVVLVAGVDVDTAMLTACEPCRLYPC